MASAPARRDPGGAHPLVARGVDRRTPQTPSGTGPDPLGRHPRRAGRGGGDERLARRRVLQAGLDGDVDGLIACDDPECWRSSRTGCRGSGANPDPGEARGAHRKGKGAARAGTGLDVHLRGASELVGEGKLLVRRVTSLDVAAAIASEANRDYDLILLGAAKEDPLHDPVSQRVVRSASVPVVIVSRPGEVEVADLKRVLVPVDGSIFSRYAAELAFAYAGAVEGAEVTLLHVADETRVTVGSFPLPERGAAHAMAGVRRRDLEAQLRAALGPTAARYGAEFSARILTSGAPGETIVEESNSGHYDLLVIGAEDKVFGRPLFFGQGTATIMERSGCTTAVVIPGLARPAAGGRPAGALGTAGSTEVVGA